MSSPSLMLRRRSRSSPSLSVRIRSKLKKTFPIVGIVKSTGYSVGDVLSDALAGFTVGLSAIPQSIAFAAIADLPLQYGMYSAFMGPFVYVLLGSVPAVTVGPTTLMALMVQKYANLHPGYAPFLALCNGVIILACGILRLGFLVDFVSTPVISAYTSAASITIACNQLKSIFGLTINQKSKLPGLLKTLEEVFSNITTIRWQDSTLGIASIILLLLLKEIPSLKCFDSVRSDFRRTWLKKFFWIFSISRNAFVVLLFASVAFAVDGENAPTPTFILTGNIVGGLPDFQLPPFGINRTSTVDDPSIGEIFGKLGSVIATLPMITTLCQIAIAKSFSKSTRVDATQEMLALGASNLFGSFFQSMPVTASFGRTAVSAASGVKTTLNGLLTGSVVLLALAVMMPYCAFIPKTTLAAVIICAVIFSIDYNIVVPLWRSKRIDLIPAFVTLVGCLFWSLEYGILVGIGINLLLILYHSARPNVSADVVKVESDEFNRNQLWISLDHGWSFPATSHIRNQIDSFLQNNVASDVIDNDDSDVIDNDVPIVLDFSNVDYLDFSSANAIRDLVNHFDKLGHRIFIFKLRDSLLPILANANDKTLKCIFAQEKSEIKFEDQSV